MARVNVVDPYTGVTLNVEEGSPQALAWGGPSVVRVEKTKDEKPEVVEAEKVSAPPRRGRPRKTAE